MEESFIIANRTDVGNAREANEDSMVTFDSPNGRVVAVCDGMGGQAAGDVASRLACDIITDILSNNTFSTPSEAITRACIAANQGILHRAAQNPELDGMGATCVMAIIKNGRVYYGWVGDSRIYYIHDGQITQVSRDQSYVQQLVDSGQITAAEAEHHPLKNEITNALGLASMTPPQLCAVPLDPVPGSVLLLCSDGLSGMVDDATICQIVSESDQPLQRRADKLIDRANANGGQDNITVQLVQFGKEHGGMAAGLRKGASKSKMLTWVAVALAVIIVGLVVGFIIGGNHKEEPAAPAVATQVKDTRKETPAKTKAQPKTVTKTEVVRETKQKSAPSKNSKKSKEDKRKNTFGATGKKGDSNGISPDHLNPGGDGEGSSHLKEQIENQK